MCLYFEAWLALDAAVARPSAQALRVGRCPKGRSSQRRNIWIAFSSVKHRRESIITLRRQMGNGHMHTRVYPSAPSIPEYTRVYPSIPECTEYTRVQTGAPSIPEYTRVHPSAPSIPEYTRVHPSALSTPEYTRVHRVYPSTPEYT